MSDAFDGDNFSGYFKLQSIVTGPHSPMAREITAQRLRTTHVGQSCNRSIKRRIRAWIGSLINSVALLLLRSIGP